MLHKITQSLIGATSLGAIEGIANVEIPTAVETENIIKLILQIIVTIATVVGLFKRKQPLTQKSRNYEN